MSLAKKKLDKTFTNANATTPKPKNIKASDVKLTSSIVKEPYPNKPLIMSSAAITNPTLAGIENSKDNCIDLFWIFETFEKFFDLNAFESTGKETVPTAIPAIAKLIWYTLSA